MTDIRKKRILIVCMWPLGGIRTYLKYVYHYFPKGEFEVTILASPTIEKEIFEQDMQSELISVRWAKPFLGVNTLAIWTAVILLTRRFDLIHSQGFMSAMCVALANWMLRIPHVLTIHGILEPKYLEGRLARLKRFIFRSLLSNVTVFHGVGEDILKHVHDAFPGLAHGSTASIVINNGVQIDRCLDEVPRAGRDLRERHGIGHDSFVFGFFGRFMPQKGFNFIIDSVETLVREDQHRHRFVVIAGGSGDYIHEYQREIQTRRLTDYFIFQPFTPELAATLKGCDTILMPSIWEAWGLLACEAMVCGVPLVGAECIGLREVLRESPALSIPPHDAAALAAAMRQSIANPRLKEQARAFQSIAAARFDVRVTADRHVQLFRKIVGAKPTPALSSGTEVVRES